MQERTFELFRDDDERRLVETTPEQGFITDFETWAGMKTDASPYALRAAALIALSLSAGDVVGLPRLFGSEQHLNLFILLVGPSSYARKTTVLDLVNKVLPVNEQSGETFVRFMDDVSIQAFQKEAAEAGATQTPILMASDEVAGIILQSKQRNHYLTGFDKTLLKGYDHSPIHIARVGRTINVTDGAFICLFGVSVAEPLQDALGSEDFASGLLARIIVIQLEEAAKGRKISLREQHENDDEWEERRARLQAHLADIARDRASGVPAFDQKTGKAAYPRIELEMTDEAWERLEELRVLLDAVGDDSVINAIRSRALIHAYRLAGLYALSRAGRSATIELIDLLRALFLLEDALSDLIRLHVGDNPFERDLRKALRYLASKGGTARRQYVMQHLKGVARAFNDLEATAIQRGYIEREDDGQRNIVWHLAPAGKEAIR